MIKTFNAMQYAYDRGCTINKYVYCILYYALLRIIYVASFSHMIS